MLKQQNAKETQMGSAQSADHPIVPGSAEDYLSRMRQEVEYGEKIAFEMQAALQPVCRPQSEVENAAETAPSPVSPLADAYAQAYQSLGRSNAILRDVMRRLDLP